MDNKEILMTAIKKATDNGWLGFAKTGYYYPTGIELLNWRWEDEDKVLSTGEYDSYESINFEAIIFRHDFAKSLWGVRDFDYYGKDYNLVHQEHTVQAGGGPDEEWYDHPIWMWHLQQNVIADNPIKYLGDNI